MATRALLDGFARVYLIKYSTGAESWQCSNIEHLEQLLTTHFSECGGMTDFVAAFGTLATLMEAATGACGPETSHHVFFLTDGLPQETNEKGVGGRTTSFTRSLF